MYSTLKRLRLISLLSFALLVSCQQGIDEPYRQAMAAERMAINEHFFNPQETPLDSENFSHFKGLKFYPVNEKYRIYASLTLLENQPIFNLPHSHNSSRPYKNYAVAKFELDGKTYELVVLEQAEKNADNENYLLLPFNDATNGKDTYGAGRYIDLDKKSGTSLIIDFNKAYNPYCAYNSNYTCPIPPKENKLPIAIEAGVKILE